MANTSGKLDAILDESFTRLACISKRKTRYHRLSSVPHILDTMVVYLKYRFKDEKFEEKHDTFVSDSTCPT